MIIVSCSILVVKNKKVLLVQENKMAKFGLPGGKLEFGETLRECAKREFFEETGAKAKIKHLVMISQKPASRENNNVVRFIFQAESDDQFNSGEMQCKYFTQNEIDDLVATEKLRGKDVAKLCRQALKGQLEPIKDPEIF
jgi:ADP-ribose pyrophosphatase YjhB (NUDIX family)